MEVYNKETKKNDRISPIILTVEEIRKSVTMVLSETLPMGRQRGGDEYEHETSALYI